MPDRAVAQAHQPCLNEERDQPCLRRDHRHRHHRRPSQRCKPTYRPEIDYVELAQPTTAG